MIDTSTEPISESLDKSIKPISESQILNANTIVVHFSLFVQRYFKYKRVYKTKKKHILYEYFSKLFTGFLTSTNGLFSPAFSSSINKKDEIYFYTDILYFVQYFSPVPILSL
uniref:Uncharacterized protein n=1 Tax=Cacopsylla melanoneura TaxID=428564 RepID=A0A8D8LZ69_9HEMI